MSELFCAGASPEVFMAAGLDTVCGEMHELEPPGQFLLVCNGHADEVALYKLCPENGLPVRTGAVLAVEKPASICFL